MTGGLTAATLREHALVQLGAVWDETQRERPNVEAGTRLLLKYRVCCVLAEIYEARERGEPIGNASDS